jgi:exonuclease SbcD
MKILWSGDWHLTNKGAICGKFVMQDGINILLQDKIGALNRICEYAEENSVDLTVIPGDIFDNNYPESVSIKVAVETVNRLSKVAPVMIVAGNHDRKGPLEQSALASLVFRENVTVCETPEIINMIIQHKGIQIFALPYPRKFHLLADPQYKGLGPEELNRIVSGKTEEILSGFRAEIDRECLSILVGHFTVSGGQYSPGQFAPMWDITIKKEFFEPFDIVCLGHLHEAHDYYSGTITRTGFDDEEMTPGFKMIEVNITDSPIGLKKTMVTEFIELSSREFFTFTPSEFLHDDFSFDGIKKDDAIRFKGKLNRAEYEQYMRRLKELDMSFIKNAAEIESEILRTSADNGNSTEEMSTEDALKLWAREKPGYEKVIEQLTAKAQEIEGKWRKRA